VADHEILLRKIARFCQKGPSLAGRKDRAGLLLRLYVHSGRARTAARRAADISVANL
jgi:hypothetical protein